MFLNNKNINISNRFDFKNNNVLLLNLKKILKKKLKKFLLNLDFFYLISFKFNNNIKLIKKLK